MGVWGHRNNPWHKRGEVAECRNHLRRISPGECKNRCYTLSEGASVGESSSFTEVPRTTFSFLLTTIAAKVYNRTSPKAPPLGDVGNMPQAVGAIAAVCFLHRGRAQLGLQRGQAHKVCPS